MEKTSFLAVHIEKFLNYLRVIKEASTHTLRSYLIDLTALDDFLKKENFADTIHQIDRKVIRAFVADQHVQNFSKRTLARRLSACRSFFKYLIKEKLIEKSPLEDIEQPKLERKIPTSLNFEQIKNLFSQPDVTTLFGFRDRCMMELLYSSGLRVSEVASLNRQDVDFANLLVKVRGKGKKERLVPITKSSAKWLDEYLNHPERKIDMDGHKGEVDHNAIFLNRHGMRITTRSIDRLFENYLKKKAALPAISRLTQSAIRSQPTF